ncbi:MAG: hypothetical protein K9G49_12750 [Taibaiella sp.]|nr:hypothetical protein [Taibaiella sp.]
MKLSLKQLSILFSIGTLCFLSCKKKVSPVVPTSTTTPATTTSTPTTYTPPVITKADKTKLNALFAALRTTPQTINVTAGKYQVVYGAKGTKLTFYPNSFKDAGGSIITSGTVTLKLVEMYKPGQMIGERATTTSSGGQLMSGGQIRISASMGGAPVYARKYGVGFREAVSSTQDMALFYGNTANEDSVATWGAQVTALGAIVGGTVVDTLIDTTADTTADTSTVPSGWGGSGYNYYQFDSCIDFNWINCDYFWNSTAPKTTVSVSIADTGFHIGNTEVFFVFPSVNSVGNAYGSYASGVSVSFKKYSLPEGTALTAIVVSQKYGNYYYAEQKGITISTNLVIPVTMKLQSLSYIKDKLGAL